MLLIMGGNLLVFVLVMRVIFRPHTNLPKSAIPSCTVHISCIYPGSLLTLLPSFSSEAPEIEAASGGGGNARAFGRSVAFQRFWSD